MKTIKELLIQVIIFDLCFIIAIFIKEFILEKLF